MYSWLAPYESLLCCLQPSAFKEQLLLCLFLFLLLSVSHTLTLFHHYENSFYHSPPKNEISLIPYLATTTNSGPHPSLWQRFWKDSSIVRDLPHLPLTFQLGSFLFCLLYRNHIEKAASTSHVGDSNRLFIIVPLPNLLVAFYLVNYSLFLETQSVSGMVGCSGSWVAASSWTFLFNFLC